MCPWKAVGGTLHRKVGRLLRARLGGGVGFHYPVRNLVKSWIRLNLFVHLVRSFCSLSLRCVLQISVTPGKKEI